MSFYCSSEDCLIKVWETTQGKLVKTLQVMLTIPSIFFCKCLCTIMKPMIFNNPLYVWPFESCHIVIFKVGSLQLV